MLKKIGKGEKGHTKRQKRLLIQLIYFFIFSYLCKSCPLNEIIELPHSSLLWETLDILEKILCLSFKESSILCVSERVGPEGANVDPQHLWSVDHLSQGPHERTVDPHQLLCVHLVSLIKHHSNLVILSPEWFNSLWKLIRYIQLMGIKKEDDAVDPLSKPLENLAEVIAWRKNALLQSHCSEKRVSGKIGLGMEDKGIIPSTWGKRGDGPPGGECLWTMRSGQLYPTFP